MLLAEVLSVLGKHEEGVQILKQTAEALGVVDDSYFLVIDRLIDLGEKGSSPLSLVESKLRPRRSPGNWSSRTSAAGLAVLKPDWPTALKLLEEAAPGLNSLPDYHKRAMLGLATCYAAMQNPDKQLEYCRLALKDDSGYILAQLGEAEALARMGKNDEALKRYRPLVNAHSVDHAYRPDLVRLELHNVLTRPGDAEGRNWVRFEESLGLPPETRPAEIQIYHAESLVARGRAAEAAKLLDDWLQAHPKDPKAAAVWVALARVKDGGKADSALAVLDAAQKAGGDVVDLSAGREGASAVRAKPVTPGRTSTLWPPGARNSPRTDQFRLLFGLGAGRSGVCADRDPEER